MTDTLDRLRAVRPEPQWPTAAQSELITRVLAEPRTGVRADLRLAAGHQRRRRGPLTVAAVAAMAAAAAVIVPAALPSDAPGSASPAAAAALHRLATVAASVPSDVLAPGQFRHMIVRERQVSASSQPSHTLDMEGWTSPDGTLWRHDVLVFSSGARPSTTTYRFAPGRKDTDYPSPAFLATLPTDPAALAGYLRDHTSGSSSSDEAVFVAIGDMLRGGYAPAPLRSAAVQVLSTLGHVQLSDVTHDDLGRPAEVFDFADAANRPDDVQSLYFDPSTARIIDEKDTNPSFVFTSVVVSVDATDSVPADIRSGAQPQS